VDRCTDYGPGTTKYGLTVIDGVEHSGLIGRCLSSVTDGLWSSTDGPPRVIHGPPPSDLGQPARAGLSLFSGMFSRGNYQAWHPYLQIQTVACRYKTGSGFEVIYSHGSPCPSTLPGIGPNSGPATVHHRCTD